MEERIFNKLFNERINSIKLFIENNDRMTESRIGGYAPSFFDEKMIRDLKLDDYLYYFTIDSSLLPIKDKLSVSVFYPKEFKLYNLDNKYPTFPIKCIFHTPCIIGNNKSSVFNEFIEPRSINSLGLVNDMQEMEDDDDENNIEFEPIYGSKIGGNPSLLQNETSCLTKLSEDGYVFIMQLDESSYMKEQVHGNEPFNHGIVYFYGKFESNILVELIGGFWQN